MFTFPLSWNEICSSRNFEHFNNRKLEPIVSNPQHKDHLPTSYCNGNIQLYYSFLKVVVTIQEYIESVVYIPAPLKSS